MNEFVRKILFLLPPELAHDLAMFALKYNLVKRQYVNNYTCLNNSIFGMDFAHPIGLAAGFDKNAECLNALGNQGFSFVEAGSVTPLPQHGNPKPRLFRLEEDMAIINRMGFNNKGLKHFCRNLEKATKHKKAIIGVNLGKNKDNLDPVSDYVLGLKYTMNYGDYFVINISSPNTPGLRSLQHKDELTSLLENITNVVNLVKTNGTRAPLLIKIAPDLSDEALSDLVELAIAYGVDGLIVSNTTIVKKELHSSHAYDVLVKEHLVSRHAEQVGGVSGKPLFNRSTRILRDVRKIAGNRLVLIGCGGVFSGSDAYEKILAGASLVQIYSALIYNGFGVINTINKDLALLLKANGFESIKDAIGAGV